MATLRELLQTAAGRTNLSYSIAIQDLRYYLRLSKEVTVIAEMLAIQEPDLLKHLQTAGLRSPIYQFYLEHLASLQSVEQE